MGASRACQAGKKCVVVCIERYIYRLIDKAARLSFMQTQPKPDLARWKAQYAQFRSRLAQTGWISEGYVQDRTHHTFRPAEPFQQFAAAGFGRKLHCHFRESHG